MGSPTAKSLVLDLLSTAPSGMPVRVLVAAAAVFRLSENNVRVALARGIATGLLERDERGRYRLGSAARGTQQQVAGWRTIEDRVRPWSGGWIAVHTAGLGRTDRAGARRRTRAFRFTGLRELAPGLEVRPDNLADGLEGMRTRLTALGLAPGALVFRLDGLEPATEARARALWDATRIRREYRESTEAIVRSERVLERMPLEQALAESFLLGGRILRQLVFDPLLPEPIVPARERRALVSAMEKYDAKGRACWARFLAQFGIRRSGADGPANVRLLAARGDLASAGGLA